MNSLLVEYLLIILLGTTLNFMDSKKTGSKACVLTDQKQDAICTPLAFEAVDVRIHFEVR